MRRAPWSVDHALVCVELMAHWATALIAAAPALTAAVSAVSVSVPSSVSVSSPSSDSAGVAVPVAGQAAATVPALAAAVAHASAVLLQSDASPSSPPSSSLSSTTVMPVSESTSSVALLSAQQQQHLRDALAPLVRRRRFIHGTSSSNAHSTQARGLVKQRPNVSATTKIIAKISPVITHSTLFSSCFPEEEEFRKCCLSLFIFMPALIYLVRS